MGSPNALLTSRLLPLLLMSVTRQRFSPKITHTVYQEYDFVIVGAGSAGATLAGRLSEIPCVSVLLLEAGPEPPPLSEVPGSASLGFDMTTGWFYRTVPQKHSSKAFKNHQMNCMLAKTLGGTSTLNDLVISRGNRRNYDHWAALGAKGWSYEEVLPYFLKLEDNLDYDLFRNGYHAAGGPLTAKRPHFHSVIKVLIAEAAASMGYNFVDSNGPSQYGFQDVQNNARDGQRCSTAKAYLVPNENRPNLHIVINATVTKILIENNRALGVQFELNGVPHQVRARQEVIVSAGAIHTPKLLMLSGIGPREELEKFKIPVIADLPVGNNLVDHVSFPALFDLGKLMEPVGKRKGKDSVILEYILDRSGELSTKNGYFLAFLSDDPKGKVLDIPEYEYYFYEVDEAFWKSRNLKRKIEENLVNATRKKPILCCGVRLVNPKSRGTVRLASADPHQTPNVDFNFLEDPDDVKVMIQGTKACIRLMENPIVSNMGVKFMAFENIGCKKKKNNFDAYLECLIRSISNPTNHFTGTAKMGDVGDPETVIDPELRVKYVQNLRVVDASVMPTIVWGHTNVPTIMIAEKAADLIKNSLHCCC